MNHFWIRFWCTMKRGFYMTTGKDQLVVGGEKAPKHFPKPNLPSKMSWWLFGGLLPIWSTTAFWVPAKPVHLRSMLSKSMSCIKNCHACNQHWSTEKGQFFSRTMSDCMSHNQCFRSWTNWAPTLCLIRHIHLISHQPTTTSSSTSMTFLQGRLPQPTGGRKCLPRVHWILKHGFLCFRNKPIHLSLAKMCSLK